MTKEMAIMFFVLVVLIMLSPIIAIDYFTDYKTPKKDGYFGADDLADHKIRESITNSKKSCKDDEK